MMDPTERIHIEQLLQLNRAHLRELERQAATLGIAAPTHIAVQLSEYRQTVAELEQRLSGALPLHNLPPRDYERFVGRQPEQEEVRRLLLPYPKSRHHLVTIDGIGGIGKSALALETAYTFRDQYAALPETERFDAIVWVSAKRSYLTADGILQQRQAFRALDDLYAAIAQALDYPAITRAPAGEQRAIVEQVLGEQRTLLILDNLETVDDEELLVFLRLLPDPTKAIVTTRHRIDVAYPVRLAGMPHDDAVALIRQEAVRKEVALAEQEQADLWQRSGGVPLAIVWSIGLMGLGGSVESVLRRLGQGQSDIARFCFAESVAQIRGRDAHKLLLALSLFASDASREALGVVAGLGEDEFGRDLGMEELLRLSLVNKEGERFSLLPLTRSFVQSEAEKQGEWMEEARERWQGYFYELVISFGGWSEDWRGQDRVERELKNVFTVIDSLEASLRYQQTDEGDHIIIDPDSTPQAKLLVRFIDRVTRTCRVRGYWSDWERLSYVSLNIGRLINDVERVGWNYYSLSKIAYYRNDIDDARQYASESRKSFQRSDKGGGVWATRLLGLIELRDDHIDEAITLLTSSMDERRRLVGHSDAPHFKESMGDLADRQNDMATAISLYQETVDVFRERNDILGLVSSLLKLARCMFAEGDIVGAQAHYEESLKLAHECGRMDVIAGAHYHIAALESTQNQRDSAEAHARQALDLFHRLGMKREQAEAEALLARLVGG